MNAAFIERYDLEDMVARVLERERRQKHNLKSTEKFLRWAGKALAAPAVAVKNALSEEETQYYLALSQKEVDHKLAVENPQLLIVPLVQKGYRHLAKRDPQPEDLKRIALTEFPALTQTEADELSALQAKRAAAAKKAVGETPKFREAKAPPMESLIRRITSEPLGYVKLMGLVVGLIFGDNGYVGHLLGKPEHLAFPPWVESEIEASFERLGQGNGKLTPNGLAGILYAAQFAVPERLLTASTKHYYHAASYFGLLVHQLVKPPIVGLRWLDTRVAQSLFDIANAISETVIEEKHAKDNAQGKIAFNLFSVYDSEPELKGIGTFENEKCVWWEEGEAYVATHEPHLAALFGYGITPTFNLTRKQEAAGILMTGLLRTALKVGYPTSSLDSSMLSGLELDIYRLAESHSLPIKRPVATTAA